MRKLLWSIVLLTLAAVVVAQQGEFLRAVNEYGPTYYPQVAEELRLPEPSNSSKPEFGTYEYSEILAARLASGQYYVEMTRYYRTDLGTPDIDVTASIRSRARQLCDVNGTPAGDAELDCLRYYAEMGERTYELSSISTYGTCRGNVQQEIENINVARDQGNITDIGAVLQYSVWATGLKWCQAYFGQPFTVVPPTSENTAQRNDTVVPTPQPTTPPWISQPWIKYVAAILVLILVVILVARGRKHTTHKHR